MGIYRKTFLNPKQLDMSTPIANFDTSSQKVKVALCKSNHVNFSHFWFGNKIQPPTNSTTHHTIQQKDEKNPPNPNHIVVLIFHIINKRCGWGAIRQLELSPGSDSFQFRENKEDTRHHLILIVAVTCSTSMRATRIGTLSFVDLNTHGCIDWLGTNQPHSKVGMWSQGLNDFLAKNQVSFFVLQCGLGKDG